MPAAPGRGAAMPASTCWPRSFHPQQQAIDRVAQAVQAEDVHLLDARSAGGRDANVHIVGAEKIGHGAAVLSSERNHAHLALVSSLQRFDYVARITAGRD